MTEKHRTTAGDVEEPATSQHWPVPRRLPEAHSWGPGTGVNGLIPEGGAGMDLDPHLEAISGLRLLQAFRLSVVCMLRREKVVHMVHPLLLDKSHHS